MDKLDFFNLKELADDISKVDNLRFGTTFQVEKLLEKEKLLVDSDLSFLTRFSKVNDHGHVKKHFYEEKSSDFGKIECLFWSFWNRFNMLSVLVSIQLAMKLVNLKL